MVNKLRKQIEQILDDNFGLWLKVGLQGKVLTPMPDSGVTLFKKQLYKQTLNELEALFQKETCAVSCKTMK